MPRHLLENVGKCFPSDKTGINASLLMTKYADISGKDEGKANAVESICKGKSEPDRTKLYMLPGVSFLCMKLMGRLMVGQSGGVLENANLDLHRNYGFPYIPGSTVKGAARHAAWSQWKDAIKSGDHEEALTHAKNLVSIFGYPTGDDGRYKENKHWEKRSLNLDDWFAEHLASKVLDSNGKRKSLAGTICFLPAYPKGPAKLEADILTSHHPNYYAGEQTVATDDENPHPLPFPSVSMGTTFIFVLRPLKRSKEKWLEQAECYLQSGLELHGIGAKTGAGYGWFERDKEAENRLDQKREARRLEQSKREALQRMTPLERYKAELLEGDVDYGTYANDLDNKSDIEKKAFIKLLQNEEKDQWKKWKKNAKKGERSRKRVDLLRRIAAEMGEELS